MGIPLKLRFPFGEKGTTRDLLVPSLVPNHKNVAGI